MSFILPRSLPHLPVVTQKAEGGSYVLPPRWKHRSPAYYWGAGAGCAGAGAGAGCAAGASVVAGGWFDSVSLASCSCRSAVFCLPRSPCPSSSSKCLRPFNPSGAACCCRSATSAASGGAGASLSNWGPFGLFFFCSLAAGTEARLSQ